MDVESHTHIRVELDSVLSIGFLIFIIESNLMVVIFRYLVSSLLGWYSISLV